MTGELLPHSANLDSSQLLSNNSKDSKDVSVQTDVPTYSSCMMLDDKVCMHVQIFCYLQILEHNPRFPPI